MPDQTETFRFIELASQVAGDLRMLDAQTDGVLTTLWFGQGAPPAPRLEGGEDVDVTQVPGGWRCDIRDAHESTILNGDVPLRAATPVDATYLSGRRVLLGLRYFESPEQIITWFLYHADHHGADSAVVLNLGSDRREADFQAEIARRLAETGRDLRFALVEAPIALGQPTLPSADHPFNAPAAPGKSRMSDLVPDARTSPLGESLIFEVLRRRLLMGARSVLSVDVTDLLLPDAEGSTIFDRAEGAEGYLSLTGIEAYPWRIPKKRALTHADHVFVQFDGTVRRKRWAVRPEIGDDSVWRFARVAGLAAIGDDARFVRCVGLRHPDQAVSALVPKSALVEDRELLDLAIGRFGHDPDRAPAVEVAATKPGPGHVTVVTCMKNEGPFILEWLAHHRAIGIDRFLIYTNDCDDGTDAMLDLLEAKGLVQHRPNPFRSMGKKPQHAAFEAAEAEEIVASADWLVAMDVDEFINIHVGKGRVTDLFGAVPEANMISMTWRLFGNSDIDAFEDRPVTEQFMRCAPELARKPHQAWGFKTLYRRAGFFRKIGVHRPKGLVPQLKDDITWVNGSGRPMPEKAYRNAWRSTAATYGYDLVTLNHYAVRSTESFLVKRDRGRVNHVDRDQGLIYWFRMNNNEVSDNSIALTHAAMKSELARLLDDPEIRRAHERSVALHRAKIAELLERPDYRTFYEQLCSARMKKLSRLHGHFGSGVFWSGPQVVPDDIVEKDPDERFFFTVDPVGKGH